MKKFLVAAPVVLALSLVFLPNFWVAIFCMIDYFTPWVMYDSKLYDMYHNFIVSRLPERDEIPLQEIPFSEATPENVRRLTKDFTLPLVIRGIVKDTPAVQNWGNKEWWVKNYGDEEVLCGTTLDKLHIDNCTISSFFSELESGENPFYISGASAIIERRPELHDMVDNERMRSIEPGPRRATQIFMGVTGMGSDLHCALGLNMFRQMVGRKKWWFIPPSQTPFLKPSINQNAFSAHTRTFVGAYAPPSPWLSRIVRYTTVLTPGDALLNPPWFWHGIMNLEEGAGENGLVVGAPTRYGGVIKAAFKSNWLFSANGFLKLYMDFGLDFLKPDFKMDLQKGIAGNRKGRDQQPEAGLKHQHPLDFVD